jgi:hypothetical protein
MKFTNILKDIILTESKFIILRDKLTKPTNKEGKKIKPLMNMDEYIQLIQADPTTRMNNVDPENADEKELEKIKPGSYTNWLIKQYLTPVTESKPGDFTYEREVKQYKNVFMEDLYKVTMDLKKFDRFKGRLPEESRDINKLNKDQLYELVKDFSLEKTKTSKGEREEASKTYEHPGAEIIFRGSDWTVAKISRKDQLGKDAAEFYGGYHLDTTKGETRWCTSSPGLSWFDRYIKDGPLYVIIPNNWTGKLGEKSGLPAERYQFHFPSNQFMDPADRQIELVDFLNGRMKEFKNILKPEFAKGLTLGNGEKLVIDSFSSGAVGKYVALYGVEDLIDNLPDKLTEFQIQNKDARSQVTIKIPKSIDRFKNMQSILLENCITEIPDTICNLPELRFLSLNNNPDLTNIPECIGNLPNLVFLNLKGSPNVKVPNSIQQKGIDMGNGLWDLSPGED